MAKNKLVAKGSTAMYIVKEANCGHISVKKARKRLEEMLNMGFLTPQQVFACVKMIVDDPEECIVERG